MKNDEIILTEEQIHELADIDIGNVFRWANKNWADYCQFYIDDEYQEKGFGVYGIKMYHTKHGWIRDLYRWGEKDEE